MQGIENGIENGKDLEPESVSRGFTSGNNTFIRNNATYGGAVYLTKLSTSTILFGKNDSFISNSANHTGGAFAIGDFVSAGQFFSETLFKDK